MLGKGKGRRKERHRGMKINEYQGKTDHSLIGLTFWDIKEN